LTLDLFWHDDALLHETGSGVFEHPPSPLMDVPELHPENAVRVRNMKTILERGPLAPHIRRREGRHAEVSELTTLHDPDYVESVREFRAAGGGVLTWSTTVGERSWEAALAAAGTALAATDAVLGGETKTAYALVRPPGHHAQPAQADGYCLLLERGAGSRASTKVGARARRRPRLGRPSRQRNPGVFLRPRRRPHCLFPHEARSLGPLAPPNGRAGRGGTGRGEGFNVNVELPAGTGDGGYLRRWRSSSSPSSTALHRRSSSSPAGRTRTSSIPTGASA